MNATPEVSAMLRSLFPRAGRGLCAARRAVAPGAPLAAGLVVALGLSGCKDLTSVEAPDVVQPEDHATPAGATALAGGAMTLFHDAFGSTEGQVSLSGAIADELRTTLASSFQGVVVDWDNRNPLDPSPGSGPYGTLHDARQRLLSAIRSFEQAAPDSSARIGQLFALLGYTSVFLGENYCAGVPLSHRDAQLRPIYGQPLTTAQLFDSALAAFDSALVYGADSARISNLARVGRGRALVNQGRFSEAAQTVAPVPTDYVYNVTFVANLVPNGFALLINPPLLWDTRHTVPEREGTNGLPWRSAHDPRVPLVAFAPLTSGGDSIAAYPPYQSPDAPIRLAGGVEARLIEAEAALQGGNPGLWLSTLNTLRTNGGTTPTGCPAGGPMPCAAAGTGGVTGLPALSDPGTPAGRVDLQFRERAFWLFLTGHRHGDLRRLVRQYGRGAETVFPTGEWKNGIPYGPATNVAPQQLGNPNYTGCLDRNA